MTAPAAQACGLQRRFERTVILGDEAGARLPPKRPVRSRTVTTLGRNAGSPPRGSAPPCSPPTTLAGVQLVAAASRSPPPHRPQPTIKAKSRPRFPGPAGLLPQQQGKQNLEQILIATHTAPVHGAVAKHRVEELPGPPPPSDEDFTRGPWLSMKTELGLDEGDPGCFLRTYSVVMVLRKAALKQLPRNKVPSMAVMIKSLSRSSIDAGAVFRDPTGEMQGTLHRLLLEQRQSELKPGAVLLLNQVGVFSPSHRNHYLNVTPTNLLRIYSPDPDVGLSQPEVSLSQQRPAPIPTHVPICGDTGSSAPQPPPQSFGLHPQRTEPRHQDPTGSDGCEMDDLDGILRDLPEDFFSSG
ncbi:LOW QUALITY PROTEIN: uncharacterized protein C17orf53 homolog [Coturnix japonica]|uniref:LOW QUALITY PROTEIN: uncharacterized protein C17orf53 homolog n=1 Tax=Coturnix japonica TaxID=93934 RepID=UPI0013A5DDE7|nr:LOW QUALITY PROTEIN: uncharacterized protein C17orf53 homolog [Coturnix japonica]